MFPLVLLALFSVGAFGLPSEHGMMMWIEDGQVHHSKWSNGCGPASSGGGSQGANHGSNQGGNPLFDRNSDTIPQGDMSAVIPSDPVSALGQDGVNPSGAEGAGHDQSGLPGTGFGSSPSLPGGGQSDIGSGLPQQPTAQRPPGVNPSYNDNNSDDDDGDDPAPFNLSPKKGGPSYNIFFPIELRHRARSAAKSSRNYNAIANSFATGRKGIANSHSLTHGDAATQQASAQGQIEQKPEV